MKKSYKKLALNKQIIANLSDVKGGDGDGDETRYSLSEWFFDCYITAKIVDYVLSTVFDDRGACLTQGCPETRYCSDYCGGVYVTRGTCM